MRVCQIGWAPNRGKEVVALPVARGATLAGVTPYGLADGSEESG